MNKRLCLLTVFMALGGVACAPVEQATGQVFAAVSSQTVTPYARRLSELTLIDFLQDRLGIDSRQAMGGVGSLFALAQQRMSPDDFMLLSNSVADMDGYLAAVPQSEFRFRLGRATNPLSGNTFELGDLSVLGASFETLGMNPEMAYQFAPLILQFLQQQNQLAAMGLLQDALYFRN